MCGRFDTSQLTWQELFEALSVFLDVKSPPQNLRPDPDVRPTTDQWIVRAEEAGIALSLARWGLVPHWRSGKPLKDTAKGAGDGFKLTTFNCRVENFLPGVGRSAVFADAYAKRRCLVPASAWYEWTGPKDHRLKHRFQRADGAVIWFAGLWDRCVATDVGEFDSFTILTAPSSGGLADYHDRAPLCLEPEDWTAWLSQGLPPDRLLTNIRPERFEHRT